MSLAEFIYTRVLKPKPLKALANAVLLRVIPESIRVGPATLYLDPADPVVSGALTLRVFEPSELAFFGKYCTGDMTVVDIGANVGLYTALAMHLLNESGRVIAFEPHPDTFGYLQKNIAANRSKAGKGPRVDAFNLAAAPERGARELRVNPENRGDNRLYQGTYQGRKEDWETLSVETRTVDEILATLGVGEVNFIKIDIQGFEMEAMSGFLQTLMRSKNIILLSEFWPKGLSEAGSDAASYLQMLVAAGFTLYELKEKPRGAIVRLDSPEQLIARLTDRKYTNIVGFKGYKP